MAWKKADIKASIQHREDVRTGPPFFKPESGKKDKFKKTYFRALPPREDHPNDDFYLWVRIHYGVGANRRTVLCASAEEKFCAVCEDNLRLKREGQSDEADDRRSQYRALLNVVEVDSDGKVSDDGILVWSCPKQLMVDLLNKIEDEVPEDEQDVTDPDIGRDLVLSKKGKEDRTRYEMAIEKKSTPLNGGDYEELLEGLHDLTAVYSPIEPERMKLLLAPSDPFEEGEYRALPSGRGSEDAEDEEGDAEVVAVVEEAKAKVPPERRSSRVPAPPAPTPEPKLLSAVEKKLAEREAQRERLRKQLAELDGGSDDEGEGDEEEE